MAVSYTHLDVYKRQAFIMENVVDSILLVLVSILVWVFAWSRLHIEKKEEMCIRDRNGTAQWQMQDCLRSGRLRSQIHPLSDSAPLLFSGCLLYTSRCV